MLLKTIHILIAMDVPPHWELKKYNNIEVKGLFIWIQLELVDVHLCIQKEVVPCQ